MIPDAPFDSSVFSAGYAVAREQFLAAVRGAGAEAVTYTHPLTGPNGEALATDVVWLGPRDAETVLVLLSATHGVEGFCGSAAQIDWLNHGALPEKTALLVVHALNPHGFAWLRRVTEDGVDLNRNFIDFEKALPVNHGYDELADAIVPDALDHEAVATADARLHDYATHYGQAAFEAALSGGQFAHADGLFYGGRAPTWSRRTTEEIVKDFRLAGRKRVAVLDFHTGLGPFGYGEPICDHLPGTVGLALARQWYGQSVTEPAIGTSSSVAKQGLSDFGWQRMLGDAVVFIALEFGTFPFDDMVSVLRGDHWLHRQGLPEWQAARTQRIKADIRRHFYPATPDWQQMVLFRSRQCIAQALNGLAAETSVPDKRSQL
ncbi:MAG: M14 family metallopeptidase [Mariprofundaceae bacterium]|nr:M14 family metallopeptidase [Mariprofundaceae bacterium]